MGGKNNTDDCSQCLQSLKNVYLEVQENQLLNTTVRFKMSLYIRPTPCSLQANCVQELFQPFNSCSIYFCLFRFCIFMSLFWHPGTSCGPRTREGFLPAGDPETGAAAEESTEASDRLWAKKPRGNRRKLCCLARGTGCNRDAYFLSTTLLWPQTFGSESHSRTIKLVELPVLPRKWYQSCCSGNVTQAKEWEWD